MGTPVPAFVAKVAGIAAGFSMALGALAIIDGVVGNSFNPDLPPNTYTTNNLTVFPADLPLINGQLYSMLFQFYKYNRPSIVNQPTLIPYGAIALPLPTELIDTSSQNYSEETSSAAISAGMEAFNAGPNPTVSQIGAGLLTSGVVATAAAGFAGINNVATKIPGADSQTAARLLQFAGVAQNPFLSLLYNSPKFKRHKFSWTFIPETAQDTENLNFILNKFRYHSLPDINTSSAGLLLNYPDMCVPAITPAGYMYDFKQCVIEGISINYAPGDTPSFNTKNAPSALTLTISLIEIEYWVKSDLAASPQGAFGLNPVNIAPTGLAPYGSAK